MTFARLNRFADRKHVRQTERHRDCFRFLSNFVVACSADYKRHERFRDIAAVKVDVCVSVDDEFVNTRMRHLLRITAAWIAGEHAVRIHVVDRTNKRRPRPKRRQI